MPGSFQTHFPALRPINQGYICVGWTSTPRGGGGAETVFFVCKCTCIVCVCVLPVRVHSVYVVWEQREFCVFCIYQQRWEEVVDARLLLALQSELESWVTFFGPLSSLSGFSFGYTSFPPTHTQTHTHTYAHFPGLLCLTRKRVIFQHLCSSVSVCLFPEASGTPGPELPLLLSSLLSVFFFFSSPCVWLLCRKSLSGFVHMTNK